MATDPKDHPLHQVPDNLPRPPGDLPPSTEQPITPPQPQTTITGSGPFAGEVEDEGGDPVGKPPRM